MITYQLVCVLVALLVTGVLVRCQPEDTLDSSPVDSKQEAEEEESLQPEETGNLFGDLFGKLESLKGKSFFNYGKNGCYRDPCYPYGGGGGGGGGGIGGGIGGGSYYKYERVPVNYGGSVSSPASYYYYYQGSAPQQPSYSPGFYYLIGVPISRPSVRVVPQPPPPPPPPVYRPVYPAPPTIQCTQTPCGNVPYYGYGTGGASAGGQFVAGSSIATVGAQVPAGGVAQEQIVGAASVPVLKGFTPSESFPEGDKPIYGVSGAASTVDGVKC